MSSASRKEGFARFPRIAVLDDYQNVARSFADWATVEERAQVTFFHDLTCPVAIGRKNWIFAGSKAGGERAAAIYSVIETAKLNGIEPQAYIADVIEKIAGD